MAFTTAILGNMLESLNTIRDIGCPLNFNTMGGEREQSSDSSWVDVSTDTANTSTRSSTYHSTTSMCSDNSSTGLVGANNPDPALVLAPLFSQRQPSNFNLGVDGNGRDLQKGIEGAVNDSKLEHDSERGSNSAATQVLQEQIDTKDDNATNAAENSSPVSSIDYGASWSQNHPDRDIDWPYQFAVPGFQTTEEPLANGGQAAVHIGRRTVDGKVFALKFFMPSKLRAEEIWASRQIRSFGQHRNLAQTHSFIINPRLDRQSVAIMEFCGGGDLYSLECRIDDYRQDYPHFKLPESFLLHILSGLANAIKYLHCLPDGSTLVHRDIKPENVMIKENPGAFYGFDVKLCDFDLACIYDPARIRGRCTGFGSPRWQPPCEKNEFRPASDVWAVGAIIWNLITGTELSIEHYPMYPCGIYATYELLERQLRGYSKRFIYLVANVIAIDHRQRITAEELVDRLAQNGWDRQPVDMPQGLVIAVPIYADNFPDPIDNRETPQVPAGEPLHILRKTGNPRLDICIEQAGGWAPMGGEERFLAGHARAHAVEHQEPFVEEYWTQEPEDDKTHDLGYGEWRRDWAVKMEAELDRVGLWGRDGLHCKVIAGRKLVTWKDSVEGEGVMLFLED